MAIGTLFHDNVYSMRKLAVRWIYEARIWLLQPSEKSRTDLSGLQILCLIHLARDACGVGADLVWVSAGTLMRMALHTGLHRDPDHLPKMSLLAAETRRRLWAIIMEILVLTSMESGGPPLVTMQDFDTKPPGNFNDEDLLVDVASASRPSPRPMEAYTDTSVQIALSYSIKIRLQISYYLNEFRSIPTYDQTLVLNSDLTSASRSFDALLRLYQTQRPGLSTFQLSLTEHIIQRYFLALHLPWLGLAKNDPRHYYSRNLCTTVALRNQKKGMAHGFLGADSGPEPNDFERLLICASSGYRNMGTQCLLVLVIELIWELEERRAANSSIDSSSMGLNPTAAMPTPASIPGLGFGLLDSQISQSNEVLEIIRTSSHRTRARIKAGDTNVKGYLFGAAMLAEAEGLLQGLTDTELAILVRTAASEAAKDSFEILKGLYAVEVGDEGNAVGSARTCESTRTDGARASKTIEGVDSMDPGSTNTSTSTRTSTMDDWDWNAVREPTRRVPVFHAPLRAPDRADQT